MENKISLKKLKYLIKYFHLKISFTEIFNIKTIPMWLSVPIDIIVF